MQRPASAEIRAATSSFAPICDIGGAVENGSTLIARELRPVGMPGTEGGAHLFQCRLRDVADDLFGVRIVHGNRALARAITADALAVDAHGVEVMIRMNC